jgi:hypothetical protein
VSGPQKALHRSVDKGTLKTFPAGIWALKLKPRMAEKKAMKMVMEFTGRMYFELGARCAICVGYTNTQNKTCVGQ